MKAKEYLVLERAVEEGVALGYNHAYKHTDSPSGESLKSEIEQAVLNAICEVFVLEDVNEPEA